MFGRLSGAAAVSVIVALLIATPVFAQNSGIARTTLQDQDGPSSPYHAITVRIEIDPGRVVMPHTHPGLENAYVEAGQGEVAIAEKGKQSLKAGDSFAVSAQTVHSVTNTGSGKLIIISTYVVDKTAPISSPAK